MPEIITRAGKGSDLTPSEADANFKATVRQVTTTASVATTDNRGTVEGNHATTPFTITLLAVATAAAVDTGDFYTTITNIGAAAVTVDANGSETINGSTDALTLAQYDSVRVELNSAGTGWEVVSDVGNVLKKINTLTSETATATTSGTTHDYTGIPSWVTKINIVLVGNSVAGLSANLELLLGDSGGFETSGYSGIIFDRTFDSAGATDAFQLTLGGTAAEVYTVTAKLLLTDSTSNTWLMESIAVDTASTARPLHYVGSKSLTGVLTQIRLQTSTGTTFDAGSFNILYE